MKQTIIIPTFNEKDNLVILFKELKKIIPKTEIIIIDDNSPDGTGLIADKIAKQNKLVKVIHRKKRLGLSSAIAEGFKHSNGNIIVVLDADLSHPPEIILKMIEAIDKMHADMVIGIRDLKNDNLSWWPWHRRMISKIGTIMARPLTKVDDPMSGLFALHKEVISGLNIKSKGYKILLEILVKGKYGKVVEIPYKFKNRKYGDSKLNLIEYYKFCIDLCNLIYYKINKFIKINIGFIFHKILN